MPEKVTSRQVRLAARPSGWPQPQDFQLTEELLAPGPELVLVRNLFLSVDPYMRGRMNDVRSYIPPFQLGEVLQGSAVGEVVAAPEGSGLRPGDLVGHNLGWREYAAAPPADFRRLERVPGLSPSTHLGALGLPGLTAYVGLLDVGRFAQGESVFVSAAAGAVGSMVGQIARMRGAGMVIGSAGSDSKVDHLTSRLGFDRAFNYHHDDPGAVLAAAGGIDVYFDNVGDQQLDAALRALRPRGRVALCGAISRYNGEPSPGVRNLALAVGKRLLLQGFLVGDYQDRRDEFEREVGGAIVRGEIRAEETIVEGIENMVEAFIGVLRGANLGKMVVRVGP